MRAALLLLLVACGGAAPAATPAATPAAPAPSDPAPVELALREGVATPIPDTDLVVTVIRIEPYQPREERHQEGAVIEHEPASAFVEVRHGDSVERVRWRKGKNEQLGPGWAVGIDGHRVFLKRR